MYDPLDAIARSLESLREDFVAADALALEVLDLYGVGILEDPEADDLEDPRWPMWRAFHAYMARRGDAVQKVGR